MHRRTFRASMSVCSWLALGWWVIRALPDVSMSRRSSGRSHSKDVAWAYSRCTFLHPAGAV